MTTAKAVHTPGPSPALEALEEYLQLMGELGELEDREHECECDGNNFHTCSLCEIAKEKSHASLRLMNLWGENWAVLLHQRLSITPAAVEASEAIASQEFVAKALGLSSVSTKAYTPGPWHAVEWACHAPTTVIDEEGIVIAECSGHSRHSNESLADARLIAAAPEMFEALERADKSGIVSAEVRTQVEAAIQKALLP